MKAQPKFNIGDSVIVKANVKDPDFDIKIEGWQGRVTEIIDKGNLINVKWDSITLENMPDSLIELTHKLTQKSITTQYIDI